MKEALLYKPSKGGYTDCFLCNHRCHIAPSKLGRCRVRLNKNGKLYAMTYGKPVSINLDPIEKKPLFHFLPGSQTLSFGTVGCNFGCLHCFTPETLIVTDEGVHEISQAYGKDMAVLTHTGKWMRVAKWFKHPFKGKVVRLKPFFLPEIECTPEHRIFVAEEPRGKLAKVEAEKITKRHFLAVPKQTPGKDPVFIHVSELLASSSPNPSAIHRKLTSNAFAQMKKMRAAGVSSREIGEALSFHPAYVRTLFSRASRFGEDSILRQSRETLLVRKGGKVRFKNGHGSGIPEKIRVTPEIARLFGLYCAEGGVQKLAKRPNSLSIRFSFGKHEEALAIEVKSLINGIFGVNATISKTPTSLQVQSGNTPMATLFAELCGGSCYTKKVPGPIFRSSKKVIGSFLGGYFDGDGCYKKDYSDAVSVSKRLIVGVCELMLIQGAVPSYYEHVPPKKRNLLGRTVNQKPNYTVRVPSAFDFANGRWKDPSKKRCIESKSHYYVPIRSILEGRHSGHVYNLEVHGDHSYTASFAAVCNCQNWEISQKSWEHGPQEIVPPEQFIKFAKEHHVPSISYTYTEPTIFYEYAKDCSRLAKKAGLANIFITNGYMTREMLDDYKNLDAANVDIKGDDRFYKKVCGGIEREMVLESIKTMKRKGVWVEATNLIIPGYNDDRDSITQISQFVKDLDPLMPLHFSAFFPSNKMQKTPPTQRESLITAREIAMELGVRYVYCGNTYPGDEYQNTYCPNCQALAIKRHGYSIVEDLTIKGHCKVCSTKIAGLA